MSLRMLLKTWLSLVSVNCAGGIALWQCTILNLVLSSPLSLSLQFQRESVWRVHAQPLLQVMAAAALTDQ
jgi:hypothetical protein